MAAALTVALAVPLGAFAGSDRAGRENSGEARRADGGDAAVSQGLPGNGLPIASGEEPGIEDWYRANVVGGPGAFLIVADSYDAFAAAFRQKLALEVAGFTPGSKMAAGSIVRPHRGKDLARQTGRKPVHNCLECDSPG